WLGGVFGWHLAVVEHLGDLDPGAGRAADVFELFKLLEVERALLLVGRVALHAAFVEDRTDRAYEVSRELLERDGLVGAGFGWRGKEGKQAKCAGEEAGFEIPCDELPFHVNSPAVGGDRWTQRGGNRGERSRAGMRSVKTILNQDLRRYAM